MLSHLFIYLFNTVCCDTHTCSQCALWLALMAGLCSCAWRIFISHLTTVVVCLSSSPSRLLFPGNGRTQNIHFMCVYMLANKNVICGLRCARYPKLQKEWARKRERTRPHNCALSLVAYEFVATLHIFYGWKSTIAQALTNGPYKRFSTENHNTVRKWIASSRINLFTTVYVVRNWYLRKKWRERENLTSNFWDRKNNTKMILSFTVEAIDQ